MITREGTSRYRTIARVVGVVYLAGFVVGIVGNGLIQSVLGVPDHLSTISANSVTLGIGALLWLMAVIGDAAHGVLMYPILRQRSERMAIGYLAARIMDAVFIAVMVLFLLLPIPLSSEFLKAAAPDAPYLQALSSVSIQASQYAYFMGMCALGLSGLMLNYVFYTAKLVPRWIAVWGLVGYAVIFSGMASEFLGSGLGLVLGIGIDVAAQWAVFGASGAIFYTIVAGFVLRLMLRTSNVMAPTGGTR